MFLIKHDEVRDFNQFFSFFFQIIPETSAWKSGKLFVGDQIIQVNGVNIKSLEQLDNAMSGNNLAFNIVIQREFEPVSIPCSSNPKHISIRILL